MKLTTINKYSELLNTMLEEEYSSVADFCEKNKIDYGTFIVTMSKMRDDVSEYQNLCHEAVKKYELGMQKMKGSETIEQVDNDEKSNVEIIRDSNNKIKSYKFQIFQKNKPSIIGTFDRNEMNELYSLYSFYGTNLPQRIVSRYFPEYSLIDIKRILRAFNITKASSPFAPHMYEEHTEEELKEILGRVKENNFLKKVE